MTRSQTAGQGPATIGGAKLQNAAMTGGALHRAERSGAAREVTAPETAQPGLLECRAGLGAK